MGQHRISFPFLIIEYTIIFAGDSVHPEDRADLEPTDDANQIIGPRVFLVYFGLAVIWRSAVVPGSNFMN